MLLQEFQLILGTKTILNHEAKNISWFLIKHHVKLPENQMYTYLITEDGKVNGKPLSSSRLKFRIGSGGLGIPP